MTACTHFGRLSFISLVAAFFLCVTQKLDFYALFYIQKLDHLDNIPNQLIENELSAEVLTKSCPPGLQNVKDEDVCSHTVS